MRCDHNSRLFHLCNNSLTCGINCGAGVFGLIGCIPLSLSLALPTFFNNNNNNDNNNNNNVVHNVNNFNISVHKFASF